MIDLQKLPREVRDLIELKEATDMTFSRFCIWENQTVFVNGELKELKYVKVGDSLIGKDGSERKVLVANKVKKKSIRIITDCMGEIVVSEDHLMKIHGGGLKQAKDIVGGDVLSSARIVLEEGGSYNDGLRVGELFVKNESVEGIKFNDMVKSDFCKGFIDGFVQYAKAVESSKMLTYEVESVKMMEYLLLALRLQGFNPLTYKTNTNGKWLLIGEELSKRRYPVVKKIEYVGEKECIDIEVDGDHLFAVGNGIVSHNCDEDYTDVLWNILAERADPNLEHSFLCSISGTQGSGKCYSEVTKVSTQRGVVEGKDLVIGDKVFDENGIEQEVVNIWNSKRSCMRIKMNFANDVVISKDHRLMTKRGLISAKDLMKGDLIRLAVRNVKNKGKRREYERGFVFGAYIADGSSGSRIQYVVAKRTGGLRSNGKSGHLLISNNDRSYLEFIAELMRKHFSFSSVNVREVSNNRLVLSAYGNEIIEEFIELCGRKSAEKKIPIEVMETKEGIRGFLDGYSNGDMTCNVVKAKKGTFKTEVGWLLKSESVAMDILDMLHFEGFWPQVRTRVLKSGKWKGNSYVRMTLPAKDVLNFFKSRVFINKQKLKRVDEVRKIRLSRTAYNNIKTNDNSVVESNGIRYAPIYGIEEVGLVKCVDIEVHSSSHLFQFSGGVVTHNSMDAISMCCFLDPNFSVDKIYFDYNELVYDRHKLRPNSAVLVDEQSQSFGLDSHRVMIILSNLKEQLRKKSIHFIFCSPNLYEESKSSMYLFETMFIDYETQESYAAMKTREGLTLGHVRIPYPLKILEDGRSLASEELIDAYQAKKDAHLEKVLGKKDMDVFEERAQMIMKNVLFLKAERIYKKRMGYIPQNTLIQIINKIFPEYQAGVVPVEIAGRIKLDKELSGEWEVSGRSVKKVDRRTPASRVRRRRK